MNLKISGLGQGIHHFDFSGPVEELKLDELFVGTYRLALKLDRSVAQILLTAQLTLTGKFACDRCGQEFLREVLSEFKTAFHFTRPNELRSEDEDYKLINFEADKIDISQELKDFSNLAIPLKNLCSEECKGLCPKCGKNLNVEKCDCVIENINPVWSPLAELKEKLNNNK